MTDPVFEQLKDSISKKLDVAEDNLSKQELHDLEVFIHDKLHVCNR